MIESLRLNSENRILHLAAYGDNKLEALEDKDKPARTKIRIMNSGRYSPHIADGVAILKLK